MFLNRILLVALSPFLAFSITAQVQDDVKYVTIMMDDGPSSNTDWLLDVLRQADVHITFDLVAEKVEENPELTRAIVADGHEIFSHSVKHWDAHKITDEELRYEIVESKRIIEEVTGQRVSWYWPPYLITTPNMEPYLKEAGMQLCTFPGIVASNDFDESVSGPQIRERVLAGTHDGSLILLHEWRDETVDELPAIIRELKARGFVFITYTQMRKHWDGEPL